MKNYGDILARQIDLRDHDAVADTTALAGIALADSADGMDCTVLADYSTYKYVIGSTLTATANVVVPADGRAAGRWIRTGSPLGGSQSGTVTLVAGTKTVNTGIVVTANSVVLIARKTQGGTITSTVGYEAPSASRVVGAAGVGTLVFNAVVAAGTVAGSDTSTLDYTIIG